MLRIGHAWAQWRCIGSLMVLPCIFLCTLSCHRKEQIFSLCEWPLAVFLWPLSSIVWQFNYFSNGRALISLMGPAIFGCRVWVHAPIQRVSHLMGRHTDRSVTTGPRWAKASRPPVVDLTHQKCVCVCVCVCGRHAVRPVTVGPLKLRLKYIYLPEASLH